MWWTRMNRSISSEEAQEKKKDFLLSADYIAMWCVQCAAPAVSQSRQSSVEFIMMLFSKSINIIIVSASCILC